MPLNKNSSESISDERKSKKINEKNIDASNSENKKEKNGKGANELLIKENGTVNLDSIVGNIANDMPNPQPHVIEQLQSENNSISDSDQLSNGESKKNFVSKEQLRGIKDKNGVSFNPDIHRTDKDNKPILSLKGNFVKKPGRRKAIVDEKSDGGAAEVVMDGQGPGAFDAQKCAMAGKAAANAMIMAGMIIGGEEWAPIAIKDGKPVMSQVSFDVDEKAALEQAFSEYFMTKGISTFPSSLGLSIAIMGYAGPRFTMPKTRSKMSRFKAWAGAKWFSMKNRRKRKEVEDGDNKKSENEN